MSQSGILFVKAKTDFIGEHIKESSCIYTKKIQFQKHVFSKYSKEIASNALQLNKCQCQIKFTKAKKTRTPFLSSIVYKV